MANIKLKDFDKHIRAKLTEAIKELTSPTELKKLGEQLREEIYVRTKTGSGVKAANGPQQKLKPLSEPYKKQRKYPSMRDRLHESTTPARSNLTQTGQMLEDMQVIATEAKVTIGFSTKEARDKVGWNIVNGRTFFAVSKSQLLNIKRIIQAKLKIILNK